MAALPRAETRGSLASWWSDSNPLVVQGPTINIHALAKPLMRRMYHRQALAFIAQDVRGRPLSEEMIEIYTSYLACKYVFLETQARVLEHLDECWSYAGAVELAPELILRMLWDKTLKHRAYSLAKTLLAHKLGVPNPQIVEDVVIQRGHYNETGLAESILGAISESTEPTTILVALLNSKAGHVTRWACTLITNLATHPSFVGAALRDSELLIEMLLNLARGPDLDISIDALGALIPISRHDRGAAAIVATNRLGTIWYSESVRMNRAAFNLLASLLGSVVPGDQILGTIPIARLLDLLRRSIKILFLRPVAEDRACLGAILDADWQREFPSLLTSQSHHFTASQTCLLIASIVEHEPTRADDLWEVATREMFGVLWEKHVDRQRRYHWERGQVHQAMVALTARQLHQTMAALTEIAKHPRGAQAVAAACTSQPILMSFLSGDEGLRPTVRKLFDVLAAQGGEVASDNTPSEELRL
ncbi:hypothetical protein FB45DRAFT_927656 [Roridomyces roridus]|uniref:Uncharacterized protein n=1 Tax=Roridomyces roridus TaxID=1738132 RepID=A0AAD7BIQ7_9AGAR|nr:hypothetical protein FB45DRAFT_927656 [Roridomyces roridus]